MNLGAGFTYLNIQVARYETILYTPSGLTNAEIEIPTAYLLPEFKRGFTFDATVTDIHAAAHEVTNAEFDDLGGGVYHYQTGFSSGGVIYANPGNWTACTRRCICS
ncbi:hypothetical protein [Cohnella zeiphila]|uniref:Uncharacterized protein n=1 Tax=Cohnella zeiphila TaxID=2761120 RepID=A0A7X0SKJ1_9BACL|nr:hypothetical protein [Cohnella zeiphila]MBB6731682.1 hypothetical protein [Cohnella zeiphila]